MYTVAEAEAVVESSNITHSFSIALRGTAFLLGVNE